jgi:cytoskeletal protein CcmA (bactofilin family)
MSIIGQDVTITGDIQATGDLHLDGKVEGDVRCAGLTLGANGRVKGHIWAEKAHLAGQIDGIVDARELVIEATARISGDIAYDNVSIAAGAQVDGRVSRRSAAEEAQPLKLVAHSEG